MAASQTQPKPNDFMGKRFYLVQSVNQSPFVNQVTPPEISTKMLSVFQESNQKQQALAQEGVNSYLTKFAHDKPITIDPAMLKKDIRAYIKPLFDSEEKINELTDKISSSITKNQDQEFTIEHYDTDDLAIIENFMDLIHEAHMQY